MKTIAVIANCSKARAPDVVRRLHARATELGLVVLFDEGTAALVEMGPGRPFDRLISEVEAIVGVGGDGTMLRIVRDLNGADLPVLGLNIGGLGFMTSVAEDEYDRALKCIAADELVVDSKAVLEGSVVRNGQAVGTHRGLNEVAMWRGPSSRVVTLDLAIDCDHVTTYLCDGIMVATPTGSTGHAMSAGGPIISPDTDAFVVTVICPHTLSSRPLVVPAHCEISVTPQHRGEGLVLCVDGQVDLQLKQGDSVRIRRSANGVRFLNLPGYSYFSVLRQKLHWRGAS